MHGKKLIVVFLVVLIFSLMFVSVAKTVRAQTNENYYAIPTPTPSPDNSTIIVVNQGGVESVNPDGQPLFFATYNWTTATLVYAECMNSSLDVSTNDVGWYENRGPTSITFVAEGIATYMLHFQVLYGGVVNQSISLTVQSGDGRTTNLPLTSYNSGFSLDVTISTSIAPSYPSAQDIWNYGNGQQQQMLENITSENQAQQAWMQTVIIGVAAGLVALVIVVVIVVRWARRTDRRQISQQWHGYGRRED